MLETTIAGKYRMMRLLGEGGMGAVYEAEHLSTRRRLAVKIITLNDVNKKREIVTRFEREARIAGSLDTEHIVQVIDSGEDEGLGTPFMVMELLVGEDLDRLVDRDGPLAPDVAVRIAAQACIGLRHAHQAGIIHRDVKPANLFLAQRDEGRVVVKILDFGIAKMRLDEGLEGDAGKLTRTGTMVGSPYFMSPEQALGEKDIDFRSDVWSLGVVLYTMLTGRTPHADVESLGQLIMAICSRPTPPVQDLAPWVPAEIAEIVHKALMHDRHKRFATTGEMLDALRALSPRGTEITRDMLGPLTAEARAHVAPRLTTKEMGLAATAALGKSAPSSHGRRSEAGSMSASISEDPRGASSRLKTALLAGGGAMAIAAVLGWALSRPGSTSAQPGPARDVPSATVAAGAPTPVVLPSAGVAPSERRTVALQVAPAGVEVEVAGQRVTVKDGIVEISGALGSVHAVKVIAPGGQSEVRDVVIAESGPVPPRVEVAPRVAGGPAGSAAAKPSASAQATTASKPGPAKPKTASTVDKNFDQ